ncbi:uncharacterized protein LOC113769296 [Coffea eugenioides]|uniref:Uncharacterized protein n=1 Tax=Coffea arabica TaxID=13443 RepID=A0A6P6XAK3_COFAR|nr:uncharacterized protein LOC113741016 [Coffea arabica]XP_027169559.1 uncharacterized protein LOC113769296 [Coffea eugenioides]
MGDWVMDDEGIGWEALLNVIPNLGDDIDNMRLVEVPTLEEVKQVIFNMDGDNDVIVFANGGADSLKRVMQILECYQSDSGQLVNVQKSGYLVHHRIIVARKRVIERVTHFHKRELPVRYPGAPLFIGRAKEAYYSDLCQKVLDKVLSWKSRLLSSGGKLILIRHVLSSIPIHLLAVGVIPKGTFRLIERVCADFLWEAGDERKKFQWIRWRDLCFPTEEGGAGFRSLTDMYKAFSYKLWWNF